MGFTPANNGAFFFSLKSILGDGLLEGGWRTPPRFGWLGADSHRWHGYKGAFLLDTPAPTAFNGSCTIRTWCCCVVAECKGRVLGVGQQEKALHPIVPSV